jgi:hypothetical protein
MAKAADQIVEKGCRIAAAMLEVAEAEVEFAQRRFVVKGTDRSSVFLKPPPLLLRMTSRPICEGR